MRERELRETLEKERGEGAWDACVGVCEELGVMSAPSEGVGVYLYGAETLSYLCGMPGMRTGCLYHALVLWPDDALIWELFYRHVRLMRGTDYLAHVLYRGVRLSEEGGSRSLAWLKFGHYLHYQAQDHAESARAYLASAGEAGGGVLPGMLALHALYRHDTSCREAAVGIARLLERLGLNESSYEEVGRRLRETEADDVRTRSELLVHLGRITLMLWGDVGRAMQWLAASFEHVALHRGDARADLLLEMARALPESLPALRQLVSLLELCEAWEGVVEALGYVLDHPMPPAERVGQLFRRMRVEALFLGDCDAAQRSLVSASLSGPLAFASGIRDQIWVLDYAAVASSFREMLMWIFARYGMQEVRRRALRYWQGHEVGEAGLRVASMWAQFRAYRVEAPEDEAGLLVRLKSLAEVCSAEDSGVLYEEMTVFWGRPSMVLPLVELARGIADRGGERAAYLGYLRRWYEAEREPLCRSCLRDVVSLEGGGFSGVEGDEGIDVRQDLASSPWKVVVEEILQYVPCTLAWSAKYPVHRRVLVDGLNSREEAWPVLHEALAEMIQNIDFFQQVVRMDERTNQQRQFMATLDDAIAMYADDDAQKTALYVKKYQVASVLGDERAKLMCLKEILEMNSKDPFAVEQVQSMDLAQLKPHAQILLCQLQVFISATREIRLERQLLLADLYVRSSQYNNAINLYHAIIDDCPSLIEPRYRLLALLIELENWKSAENVLLGLVNLEVVPERRYRSLVELATIQDERMMMPSRALLSLFAAIDILPLLEELHPKLCEISDRLHSYSPLIDKYEELAKCAADVRVRRMAIFMLANVYFHRLKKPGLAFKVLGDFRESAGGKDIDFLRLASEFYREAAHWEGYIETLGALIEVSDSREECVRACLSIAQIYTLNLHHHARASHYARMASEIGTTRIEDWREISHILMVCGDQEGALGALRQALTYEAGFGKVDILLSMVDVLIELDRLEDATAAFHEAALLRPGLDVLTPVAESLIALATAHHHQHAFEILCGDLVQACPKSEQRGLLLQQALTLVRIFDDPHGARRIVESMGPLTEVSDLEQGCMLADILRYIEDDRGAIRVNLDLLRRYALSDDLRHERLEALLASAVNVNDVGLVRETCREILAIDEEDTHANFRLIQLDYHAGRWDQASMRIQKFLPYLERLSAESAMLLHYYYGDILHAAEHNDLAIECLDNALRIRMDFRPAVDLKLTILLEQQRWPEALPMFSLLLDLTEEPEVRGAIHKRIAEVYHFYMHDPNQAILGYELALTLGGDVEDVPIRLLQLYQSAGSWHKAALTAQVLANAQVNSPDARLAYLLVLGDIWSTHLGDVMQAVHTYLEAFTIEPLHDEIIGRLTRLLLWRQDFENYRAIVEQVSALVERYPDRVFAVLTFMARECRGFEPCREIMSHALARVQTFGSNHTGVVAIQRALMGVAPAPVSLQSEASSFGLAASVQKIPPVNSQISGGGQTRRETLPRVTFDSSLRQHPEASAQGSSVIETVPLENVEALALEGSTEGRRSGLVPSAGQAHGVGSDEVLQVDDIATIVGRDADSDDVLLLRDIASLVGRDVEALPEDSILPIEELPESLSQISMQGSTVPGVGRLGRSLSDSSARASVSQEVVSVLAFEKLTFGVEELRLLSAYAEESQSRLLGYCLEDLFEIANMSSNVSERPGCPEQLSAALRHTLLTLHSQSATTSLLKLLSTLATHELSPCLSGEVPVALPEEKRREVSVLAEQIRELVDLPAFVLGKREVSGPPLLAARPPVVLLDETTPDMGEAGWTARLTYAMVLARPEFMLVTCLSSASLYDHLEIASIAINPLRHKSADYPKEILAQYQTVLSDSRYSPLHMPRISQATLPQLKQLAQSSRRMAIQVALHFSQSLRDCLEILCETENVRLPTSLAGLKSAMKQSPVIKGLVLYAMSPQAQKIHRQMFDD